MCPVHVALYMERGHRKGGLVAEAFVYVILQQEKEKKTENPRYPKTKQKKVKSHTPEKPK
jgi:hypothetical protein